MLKILIFLFLVAIASTISIWFVENDGGVVINWLGYRVQTSMSFLTLFSLTLAASIAAFVQLFSIVKRSPKRYQKHFADKRKEKGLTALTEGFVAIAAGDSRQARSLTKKASRYLGSIAITKLLSAQTAQLEGNDELANRHYTSMLENKETEMIAIKGLLLEARKSGDIEKAIFLAEKAYDARPDADWAISILTSLYKQTMQWDKALQMLKKSFDRRIIDQASMRRAQAIIRIARIDSSSSLENSAEEAHKAYKILPNFIAIAIEYAKSLINCGQHVKAAKIIEAQWKILPNGELGELYMQAFKDDNSEKQLQRAEKLLKLNPNHQESHILVAACALKCNSYSKARNHLKIALGVEETKRICDLLAKLEKLENADVESVNKWLNRAENAAENPGWVCSKCNHLSQKWSANCKNCNSFDSLGWQNIADKPSIDEAGKLVSLG